MKSLPPPPSALAIWAACVVCSKVLAWFTQKPSLGLMNAYARCSKAGRLSASVARAAEQTLVAGPGTAPVCLGYLEGVLGSSSSTGTPVCQCMKYELPLTVETASM